MNLLDIPTHIASVKRIARFAWTAAGRWSVVWLALVVSLGLFPAATVLVTKRMVDALVAALAGRSWPQIRLVLIYVAIMACIALVTELLFSLQEWVKTLNAELIHEYIVDQIQKKSVEVDLAFYESPEYYDQLYRARDDAHIRPAILLEHFGAVVQNTISVAVLTIIVATYSPWLIFAMLASVVPAFAVVARHNWLVHLWWKRTTVERRWIQYYDQKFSTCAAAAELRLFGLAGHFQQVYRGLRQTLRSQRLAMIRQQNIARLGAAVAGLLVIGATVAWIGWRAFQGKASLGDLTLFYQAIVGGQSLMRGTTASLAQVYSNSLFLSEFFRFLALKPKVVEPAVTVPVPSPIRWGIAFENVGFSYPGSDRPSLENCNLLVPAGKIVAVVGPNGAGKSTLIKLLCRFYDVDSGRITLDGADIRDLPLRGLRENLSVLFQTPVSYDASALENIAVGDIEGHPDRHAVETAARLAGAHRTISRLPAGYDTPLGKSFESGCELSAGEWQRVAMARAFLRRAGVILLDEPTSFMDSWAEADWFERLRVLARARTAVVITHRFTIAMRADVIYVMRDGAVIESGTHASLLSKGGFYAESWRQQTEATSTAAAAECEPAAAGG
jgi:ATP-binding cassette, subfamily B, bacterial